MTRPSWDTYFMAMAHVVATRATCDRKHVGAVIVTGYHVVATGYNGSMPREPHCDDVGHLIEDGHCVRTIHAESNAIAQAARYGISTVGTTIYVTALPCWGCYKLCVNAGITRVVYAEAYRPDERVLKSFKTGLDHLPFDDASCDKWARYFADLRNLRPHQPMFEGKKGDDHG